MPGDEIFDFVVVGAGSAGCVLAARLSEDRRTSVLVIEAGGRARSPWLHVPIGFAKTYYHAVYNWGFLSEPQAELNGRRLYCPRGKVQGGSGAINAMIFLRGAPADFDGWAAEGNAGWSYADVLPYFRKLEQHETLRDHFHGADGPIHVTPMREDAHPICEDFLAACRELGFPANPDFNGATFEGAGIYDINTRRGLRSSPGVEYLRPALKRPNLSLRRDTTATRVVFDSSKRAVGVQVVGPDGSHIVRGRREIILCAGAVGTPQLLQLSGVGDGALLQALGIPAVQHLPAVGQHLQDHVCASFYFRATRPTLNDEFRSYSRLTGHLLRYALRRKGPLAVSVNQAGGFFRARQAATAPDTQVYFNPLSYRLPRGSTKLRPEPYSGFLIAFNPCRPTSRGSIAITSAEPARAPAIDLNFLSTEQDRADAIAGCRLVRRLTSAPALRSLIADEISPGREAETDADLLAYFRENCGSIYHLCGTARMGSGPAVAAVDPALRVYGVSGLRICDASVFPSVTSANIHAPVLMVAEKAAAMIRQSSL